MVAPIIVINKFELYQYTLPTPKYFLVKICKTDITYRTNHEKYLKTNSINVLYRRQHAKYMSFHLYICNFIIGRQSIHPEKIGQHCLPKKFSFRKRFLFALQYGKVDVHTYNILKLEFNKLYTFVQSKHSSMTMSCQFP